MAPSLRGLTITRYQADTANPDRATAETVELMCEQIRHAAHDGLLQAAAQDAVRRFRGGPLYAFSGRDPFQSAGAIACSAWWWVKHALKFQLHDGLIQVWFNERDQLQLLISPDLLLRMDRPRGDCAIYTMLECAMLRCFGIPFEIVTAAVTPNDPQFDHVWCRAILPNGQRLNLDASHGKYPGWQVPFEHRNRTQIWDENANPIPDQAPKALQAYRAYPTKPILPKRLALMPGVGLSGYLRFNRGMGKLRGLGQDSTDSGLTTVDSSGNIVDMSGNVLGNVGTTPVTAMGGNVATAPNPFVSALPNMLGQGMNILGQVVAPQTTVQGPGGVVVTTPSSNAPAVLGPLGAMGVTGGGGAILGGEQMASMMPILLIAGLGLVLVLAMSGGGRH